MTGSTDGTKEILDSLKGCFNNLRVIRHTNRGKRKSVAAGFRYLSTMPATPPYDLSYHFMTNRKCFLRYLMAWDMVEDNEV